MSPELKAKLEAPEAQPEDHQTHQSPPITTKKKASKNKRPFQSKRKHVRHPDSQTPNPTTTTKRKSPSHPPAKKQLRIDHFLEKGKLKRQNLT